MTVPNINPANPISAALTQEAWDAKLREESATGDIFSQNMGIYNDKTKSLPDAVVVKVKGAKGETKRTLGMLNRLSGSAQIGAAGELRGNEENQTTREIEIYANEWFNGVSTDSYGLEKVKQDPYGIYKSAQPQLSTWAKETKGKYIRQALCEKVDVAQSTALVSNGLAIPKVISPNFLVSGDSAPVTYDSTAADYLTNIFASLANAAKLDVDGLNKIEEVITSQFEIEPVTINGKAMYVVTVPTRQKSALRTPGTGTFIELLKDGDSRGESNRAIAHVLGSYGSLLLVEDMRSPVIELDALPATATTLTFQYKGAGSSDSRVLTVDGLHFDVGFVLGKAAVIDYDVEPLHFEKEVQNYNRNWGIGAFSTSGYTRSDYDLLAAKTDTSIRNQSSALLAFKVN